MIYVLYCLLIVVFSFLGGRKGRLSLLFRLLACIAYICIVGFRSYSVGVDSERYMELFYAIPNQNYQWIEIGFDRLIRFLYDAGFSYNGLFLVCIILTAIPMFLVLEKCKDYTFSAILMYILTLTAVTNGIRQCISVAIFLFASIFIIRRKMIPFFLCMFFALIFHSSSIILFPLYFIAQKSLPKESLIIAYVISFVFCFIDVSSLIKPVIFLMGDFGRDYSENFNYYAFNFGSLSILGFFYNTTLNIIVFYMMIATNANKKYPVYTNFIILSFILKNIAFNMPIAGRILMYFSWFEYLLIPLLIYELYSDRKLRNVAQWLIVTSFAVGFIHNITSREMKMLPYEYNTIILQ